MSDHKEWFIIVTNDFSEPFDRYRILSAFNLAACAQKKKFKLTIGLQAIGVECVQERFMKMDEKIGAKKYAPLPSLSQSFTEFRSSGGRVIVDRLSVEAFGSKQKMVEGVELAEPEEFVAIIAQSDKVLVY